MNKLMIALYLLLIAPSAFCDALGSLYHLQNCLTELERLNGQLRSAAAQRSTTQAFKDSQIASLQSAFATTVARCRTLSGHLAHDIEQLNNQLSAKETNK